MKIYTLGEIAEHIEAQLHGDHQCKISAVATLQSARAGQLSFLSNNKYRHYLSKTKASAVILQSAHRDNCLVDTLVVDDPYLCYAHIVKLFHPEPELNPGIHTSAVLSESSKIDSSAMVGAHVVVGENVTIGAGTFIDAGCVIKDNVTIGSGSHLYPNVVLCHSVSIGNRVILHSGAVIGADGFGFANDKGVWQKVYQIGTVIIEDDVEVGANSTIDRGALGNTVIERGVKIDNQVQVAHNVHIGANTAIAGCVGIAGSTNIGKCCMIGGGVGISGHIEIADHVTIAGRSVVTRSLKSSGVYSSVLPVEEVKIWRRIVSRIKKLDHLVKRINKIESRSK